MKASVLLAVVLTASAMASAGYVSLAGTPRPASEDPEVPTGNDSPPVGWQDPPEIDVSWSRSGVDVVVTFTQVDEPKLLDCAWHADVYAGDWPPIAYGNFTDREAWRESSRYSWCMDPDWPSDPPWPEPFDGKGLALRDADDDNRLSPGDTLTILDVGTGEADLRLVMAFWGAWSYEFRWHAGPGGDPTI